MSRVCGPLSILQTTRSMCSRRRTQNKCNSVDLNGKGGKNNGTANWKTHWRKEKKESRLEMRKDLQFFKQDGSSGRDAYGFWVHPQKLWLPIHFSGWKSGRNEGAQPRNEINTRGFRIQCLCKSRNGDKVNMTPDSKLALGPDRLAQVVRGSLAGQLEAGVVNNDCLSLQRSALPSIHWQTK